MDKEQGKGKWDWLPARMPGVARQLKEQRAKVGDAWVNECWKRGVVNREPGWFWAAEGALSVGTMWDNVRIIAFATMKLTDTQSLVVLRDREASDGAQ